MQISKNSTWVTVQLPVSQLVFKHLTCKAHLETAICSGRRVLDLGIFHTHEKENTRYLLHLVVNWALHPPPLPFLSLLSPAYLHLLPLQIHLLQFSLFWLPYLECYFTEDRSVSNTKVTVIMKNCSTD